MSIVEFRRRVGSLVCASVCAEIALVFFVSLVGFLCGLGKYAPLRRFSDTGSPLRIREQLVIEVKK